VGTTSETLACARARAGSQKTGTCTGKSGPMGGYGGLWELPSRNPRPISENPLWSPWAHGSWFALLGGSGGVCLPLSCEAGEGGAVGLAATFGVKNPIEEDDYHHGSPLPRCRPHLTYRLRR
jgi:hypothetical protein